MKKAFVLIFLFAFSFSLFAQNNRQKSTAKQSDPCAKPASPVFKTYFDWMKENPGVNWLALKVDVRETKKPLANLNDIPGAFADMKPWITAVGMENFNDMFTVMKGEGSCFPVQKVQTHYVNENDFPPVEEFQFTGAPDKSNSKNQASLRLGPNTYNYLTRIDNIYYFGCVLNPKEKTLYLKLTIDKQFGF